MRSELNQIAMVTSQKDEYYPTKLAIGFAVQHNSYVKYEFIMVKLTTDFAGG